MKIDGKKYGFHLLLCERSTEHVAYLVRPFWLKLWLCESSTVFVPYFGATISVHCWLKLWLCESTMNELTCFKRHLKTDLFQ